MIKRKSIRRGQVYVVPNEQGGIYTFCPYDDSIVMVHVEQITIWADDSKVYTHTARAILSGPISDIMAIEFSKGSILSGQIITVQQTEPVDVDNPLDHLLGDGHIRTPDGQYLWQYSYYQPNIEFSPTTDVDELLLAPY